MRVLVTRSEEDAARTAERLARRGHEAVVAPLTEILGTGEPPPPGPHDGILLTSAQAAPFLRGIAAHRAPVFAVGHRTAEAAESAGLTRIRIAGGDARSLAATVARDLAPGSALLHVAGRHRKAEPAASLMSAGFAIRVWEAYEAKAVAELPSHLPPLLEAGRIDAALHYSRRSAAILVELCARAGLRRALRDVAHFCLSEDVAAALVPLGIRSSVAARADEEALLAALDGVASGPGSPPPVP